MQRTHAIVIGGGQAGLAMSRCLHDRGIDHVVLEQGRLAERWRSARWDSLRLLSPNWMSRLPGWTYRGTDPDGFMTAHELACYLEHYARSFAAPVETATRVCRLERRDGLYRVETDRGDWQAPVAVIATGQCQEPAVPAIAARLPATIRQFTPATYRAPRQLPQGPVLVVGASSSGVQLAQEIHQSGRPVTLAVGQHTRLPRRYRGRDIMWWLDRAGVYDERAEALPDLASARRQPSLQLIGSPDGRSLDLGVLRRQGVRLAGRLIDIEATRVRFADNLAETMAAAEQKLLRLVARIDDFIAAAGMTAEPAEPPPLLVPERGPAEIDLAQAGIAAVVWATGYARRYPWLRVPVLDPRGEIEHHGGVTRSPGLYVLGLQFLRRRKSHLIDGVGSDAEELADHMVEHHLRRNDAAA
jgi:putative flavoprotein involved in K+ transport